MGKTNPYRPVSLSSIVYEYLIPWAFAQSSEPPEAGYSSPLDEPTEYFDPPVFSMACKEHDM